MRTFHDYAALGYGPQLLPILPPNAPISTKTKSPVSVTASRGKIPGKKLRDGWVGFPDWETHVADEKDWARWTSWGAGIGLQAALYPAFDVDVDEPEIADLLRDLIQFIVGVAPVRTGRAPRVLLPFRADPNRLLTKRRLAFSRGAGPTQAIELLGAGQQYVLEGIHPRTGEPYSWAHGPLPAADLIILTPEVVDAVFAAATTALEQQGLTIHGGATEGRSRSGYAQGAVALAPSLDAIRAALAARANDVPYEEWLVVGRAVKAASDASEDAFDLWLDWSLQWPANTPEGVRAKWDSFDPPHRVSWDWLQRWAGAHGGFSGASFEFEPVAEIVSEEPPIPKDPFEALWSRYVWVAALERAMDTQTGKLLTRTQFNVQCNNAGNPSSNDKCAWAKWLRNVDKLQRADGVTYRPGCTPFIDESWGRCANTWRAGTLAVPDVATDSDIGPWLEHAAFLLPKQEERDLLLDWLAFLLQRQNEKPSFAMLLGSPRQGVGKDMLMQPIIVALGEHNVGITTADQICGRWTDWAEGKRLVLVEEMEHFGRRETENRLKPYLAAPPHVVPIEKKMIPLYTVPNIFGMMFMTNNENALPLSREDRRTCVLWSEAIPKDESYYCALVAWYENGGYGAVARWLLERDISAHLKRRVAPLTAYKVVMQRQALSPLEDWIVNGIEEETGPFTSDLVEIGDVLARVPSQFHWNQGTEVRLASFLRRAGAKQLGRIRLGQPLPTTGRDRGNLYSVRRHEMYEALSAAKLSELFVKHYAFNQPFDAISDGIETDAS